MKLILICCVMLSINPVASIAQTADTSCGIIWDEPILLSDSNYNAYSPKLALSGDDTVHITWENSTLSRPRLPYLRSVNGGSSFLPPRELLADSNSYPFPSVWNHIVAWRNRVYAFFVGSTAGDTPVRMLTSTNAGADWSGVTDISPDTCGIIQHASIYGDTLAIVYPPPPFSRRILRSTNSGMVWTRTNESLNYFARVALSAGGVLHLVQLGSAGSGETEYRRSHDLGDSWVQQMFLSTIDQYFSYGPAIRASPERDDSSVIVAWGDDKYGNIGLSGGSIISRTGIVGIDSTRWDPEELLTTEPRGSNPSAAINNNMRAVAWPSEVVPLTTWHAAIRISKGLDSTWCAETDLTPETPHIVGGMQVALSRKAVHVVWSQNVAPSPGTFRIFYRRGLFKTVGVKYDPPSIPELVHLEQNHPNPFNPTTSIRYALEKRMFVMMKVYDILGREIRTLISEQKEPGDYTVQWDAESIPTGVYFYRLFTEGEVLTRKAILIR